MTFPMMPLQAYFAIWWHSCLSAEPALEQIFAGKMRWTGARKEQGKQIEAALSAYDKQDLLKALRLHTAKEWESLCQGAMVGCKAVNAQRASLEAPVIWQKHSVRLRDYAPQSTGHPLLVIPSLINRSYIFDLHPKSSFLRYLIEQNYRPFVVEWNDPVAAEYAFTPAHYVEQYLFEIQQLLVEKTKRKPFLFGYCMGGILGLSLAQLAPHQTQGLILCATPWDFHVPQMARIALTKPDEKRLSQLIAKMPYIPAQVVQSMFYWLYPDMVRQKLKRLAYLGQEVDGVSLAMEGWVNDGIGLTGSCAETFWLSWMQHNQLMQHKWQVNQQVIAPESIKNLPVLCVSPRKDKIVPVESTLPVVNGLKLPENNNQVAVLEPDTGHVGVMIGRKAKEAFWQPCHAWMTSHLLG